MMGAIDGSHIPLLYELQRGLTPMPCDIFNKKKFHSVLLQDMYNSDKFFWNVCAGQLEEVHDAAQFA